MTLVAKQGLAESRHLKVDGRSKLKPDQPLFDWLINCVILNHF